MKQLAAREFAPGRRCLVIAKSGVRALQRDAIPPVEEARGKRKVHSMASLEQARGNKRELLQWRRWPSSRANSNLTVGWCDVGTEKRTLAGRDLRLLVTFSPNGLFTSRRARIVCLRKKRDAEGCHPSRKRAAKESSKSAFKRWLAF